MKKILSAAALMLLAASATFGQGKMKEKPASPHDTVKANHMMVTYGRPYKKGRVIFGDGKSSLETYGKVWRTGANEATQITIDKNCTFGGKQLSAGTYTLFTIPNEKEWTVILNSELKQWGAYGYDKIKDKDVLQATVPARHLSTPVEELTISIKNDGLQIEWDQSSVFVPVKF